MNRSLARRNLVLGVAFAVVAPALVSHAAAPTGRYTIANGTVYDTKTKLTWQQTIATTTYAWANAKTACSSLSLSGTGWRLPTRMELLTIADYSVSDPAIDTAAFPNTPSGVFWTSTLDASGSGFAWIVHFHDGSTYPYDGAIANVYYVRCVR